MKQKNEEKGPKSSLIVDDGKLLEMAYSKAPITFNIKKRWRSRSVHEMAEQRLSIQAHRTVILPSRIQKDLLAVILGVYQTTILPA